MRPSLPRGEQRWQAVFCFWLVAMSRREGYQRHGIGRTGNGEKGNGEALLDVSRMGNS